MVSDNDAMYAFRSLAILNQPSSLTVTVGSVATFSVTLTANSASSGVTYAWAKDGVPVGSNSSTLSYVAGPADLRTVSAFVCTVTHALGRVMSSIATLTIVVRHLGAHDCFGPQCVFHCALLSVAMQTTCPMDPPSSVDLLGVCRSCPAGQFVLGPGQSCRGGVRVSLSMTVCAFSRCGRRKLTPLLPSILCTVCHGLLRLQHWRVRRLPLHQALLSRWVLVVVCLRHPLPRLHVDPVAGHTRCRGSPLVLQARILLGLMGGGKQQLPSSGRQLPPADVTAGTTACCLRHWLSQSVDDMHRRATVTVEQPWPERGQGAEWACACL
jgi:hypothetical protein